ncbi:hypothetical protein XENOCAPTIV_008673 [Xenoophorus captivus]|uniref:Uncharacterized protein n=1 Tax=Xenoophorus captivus TaxID=1517983 RepID=A0ABV0SF95_9TELE
MVALKMKVSLWVSQWIPSAGSIAICSFNFLDPDHKCSCSVVLRNASQDVTAIADPFCECETSLNANFSEISDELHGLIHCCCRTEALLHTKVTFDGFNNFISVIMYLIKQCLP